MYLICRKCGQINQKSDFCKSSISSDGNSGICSGCRKAKDKDYYNLNRDLLLEKSKKYHVAHRDKRINYAKEYYQNNKESQAISSRERYWKNRDHFKSLTLTKIHGISLENYMSILEKQNGVCAICGGIETLIDPRTNTPRHLAVDHDHLTGIIRGLLCSRCNTTIGKMNDDPALLIAAAKYLESRAAGA